MFPRCRCYTHTLRYSIRLHTAQRSFSTHKKDNSYTLSGSVGASPVNSTRPPKLTLTSKQQAATAANQPATATTPANSKQHKAAPTLLTPLKTAAVNVLPLKPFPRPASITSPLPTPKQVAPALAAFAASLAPTAAVPLTAVPPPAVPLTAPPTRATPPAPKPAPAATTPPAPTAVPNFKPIDLAAAVATSALNMSTDKNEGTNGVLVWVDLEMTGLEEHHKIIEAACIITDNQLVELDRSANFVIYREESCLEQANEWVKGQFADSLFQEVRKSTTTIDQCEQQFLALVQKWSKPNTAPLAGNSVHVDRTFLQREMPQLMSYLHYRIVDVSSIKEVAWRWYPNLMRQQAPKKKSAHRALDDIQESIEELKFYRERIFLKQDIGEPKNNSKK